MVRISVATDDGGIAYSQKLQESQNHTHNHLPKCEVYLYLQGILLKNHISITDICILKKLFIYLWLSWVFIAECRLSLVTEHMLLIVMASLVVEHGL